MLQSKKMFLNKIFSIFIILGNLLSFMKSNDIPFSILPGLFDPSQKETMGLEYAPGIEIVKVFSASDDTNHYNNGVVMTSFKGKLYCMWQTSPKDEDSEDTEVVYSISDDMGKTWSTPKNLSNPVEGCFCTSGGWLSTESSLIAYINVFNSENFKKNGGTTHFRESLDGLNWSEQKNLLMHDGSHLNGIFEQDPHKLPDGRIINAAHFQPGLKLCPIYTDDPTGKTGWKKGKFEYTDNGDQSVELEPSFYIQSDGALIMIMRDQKSRWFSLASKSDDRGETWTKSMLTNMPDSRAKQCAGNLPDGTAFLVNNPGRVINENNKTWRIPLSITLSKDGFIFTKSYLLRAGKDGDYPKQKYEGNAKTLGYSYPKAFIYENFLYVSYSTNKDDAEYTRIPIKEISLNSK